MRGQSIMGAVSAQLAVHGGGGGGGRRLYEGGEEERPGRSEMTYMQHKYTPMDTRIIIITAAFLLLLLFILFLNFFIRWALRTFFLSHSQKPLNPNKGLSKRQVQALPSFIYSSSKPPIFGSWPTPPSSCALPNFYHHLMPKFTCHGDHFGHDLKPISSHSCHDFHPTQILSTTLDGSLHNDRPTKFDSLTFDDPIEGNNPPTRGDEVANDSNSIIDSTKANVLTIDSELKANLTPFKDGNCTKDDEMTNHGEDNATSPSPCSICLVDYADGDKIRVLPTCQHYFHIECIDMWLAKNSSCPACRANILEATRIPIKQPTLQVQVIITTSH